MAQDYDDIIYPSAVTAASAAAVGGLLIPGSDLGTLPATWTFMTIAIAERAGHEITPSIAGKFITSILGGVVSFLVRQKAMSKILLFLPGLGILGAATIDAFIVALVTIRLGKFLIGEFEKDNFDLSNMDNMAGKAMAVLFLFTDSEELKEVFEFIKNLFGK